MYVVTLQAASSASACVVCNYEVQTLQNNNNNNKLILFVHFYHP